jgi:hypothetical protein
MIPQPVHDLRKRLEVGFIGARYGRLEVVHDDRQTEGVGIVIVVQVPARGDPTPRGFLACAAGCGVIGLHRCAAKIAEYARLDPSSAAYSLYADARRFRSPGRPMRLSRIGRDNRNQARRSTELH